MIDLRSDTVTRPTAAMYQAMQTAPLGDDVYGDDPTVNQLQELAAQLTGKEAALFVCSGTMGNQLAIMGHTRPGEEMIAGLNSHVIQHEAGAHARLSLVSAMTVDRQGGLSPEDIEKNVREKDIHHPVTSLVCLENALSDGSVVPLEKHRQTAEAAHRLGLKVHLDGARLFNAAAALGVSASELASPVDSVMFCLSKGLCAPVGSMLCGSREFIGKARRNRKVIGGALRQAGVLAACGLTALTQMTNRLAEDHANASTLARLLHALPQVQLDTSQVQTNMVFCQINQPGFDDKAFVTWMKEHEVLLNAPSFGLYRFVTHHDVSAGQIKEFVQLVQEYLAQ